MHKLVNGKLEHVNSVKHKPQNADKYTSQTVDNSGEPVVIRPDNVSKSARALIAGQGRGIGWAGLEGTGANGQITKKDVEKYLAANESAS